MNNITVDKPTITINKLSKLLKKSLVFVIVIIGIYSIITQYIERYLPLVDQATMLNLLKYNIKEIRLTMKKESNDTWAFIPAVSFQDNKLGRFIGVCKTPIPMLMPVLFNIDIQIEKRNSIQIYNINPVDILFNYRHIKTRINAMLTCTDKAIARQQII